MNREEKNQITKEKIKNSAIREFALHGYEVASLNEVCKKGGISKGIIYHYFQSKEDLYIECIEECFRKITEYLQENIDISNEENLLMRYFDVRMDFLRNNQDLARLFCGGILAPPEMLKDRLRKAEEPFDEFNVMILHEIISKCKIRSELNESDILRVFNKFQNFINAGYPNAIDDPESFSKHEEDCRNAMNIFLYGIIGRE